MLVHDILHRNASYFGDDRALMVPGVGAQTWLQLQSRVHRFAHALSGLGLEPGDVVAIYAPNCAEYVEFNFACAASGLVGAALNVRLAPQELIDYVSYVGPRAVLVHHELAPSAARWLPQAAPDALQITIGGGAGPGVDLEGLMAASATTPPDVRVGADDVYQLAATSGTTGRTKAARMTHRNAVAAMVNWLCEMPVGERDVALQCIPQFFNPGGPAHLHPVMMKGGCVIIPSAFAPERFVELALEHSVTHAVLVPTMLQMILDVAEASGTTLDRIKGINTGGSPLSPELVRRGRRTFGDVFYPIYGMAETFSCATMLRPEALRGVDAETEARRLSSVGRPMVLTDLRVVDEAGVDVPADGATPGEIWLTGDTVSPGYLDATGDSQSREGRWFRTGDVAVVDEEHFVAIVDRLKDVIITGGINVISREIEEVLQLHPAVEGAAVIGLPHPRWGEGIHAIVVRRPDSVVGADDLIEHVGCHLAGYKKPQTFEFVDSLPVGSTGKVLKRRLREERLQTRSCEPAGDLASS
jgi:acyl-CoA synthetase (AMP-forming)/AMP-acid ligase II